MNIFDQESAPAPIFQCAQDIERAYKNSLFFYFHEGDPLDPENGREDDEEDDFDDEEDDEEDQQPVKKKKKNDEAVEKPECNQQ